MDTAKFLIGLFFNRTDQFAAQTATGKRYFKAAALGRNGIWALLTERVEPKLVYRHLRGALTIATYTPFRDLTRWLCLDFDGEGLTPLEEVRSFLWEAYQVTAYLERSRRGGHLWVFFTAPAKARKVRTLAKYLLKELQLAQFEIEIFPKTDDATDRLGNAVRLPFGIHRATGERYLFADVPGRTWEEQVAWFRKNIHLMPLERLDQVLATVAPAQEPPRRAPVLDPRPITGSYVAAIKEKLPILELASRLTSLKPSDGGKGRFYIGRCPFPGHKDVHPLFWVDAELNVANCFKPNCGSEKPMDVVNVWARHRGITDEEAISELAAELGIELPPAELLIRIPGLGLKPVARRDDGQGREKVLRELAVFLNGLYQGES